MNFDKLKQFVSREDKQLQNYSGYFERLTINQTEKYTDYKSTKESLLQCAKQSNFAQTNKLLTTFGNFYEMYTLQQTKPQQIRKKILPIFKFLQEELKTLKQKIGAQHKNTIIIVKKGIGNDGHKLFKSQSVSNNQYYAELYHQYNQLTQLICRAYYQYNGQTKMIIYFMLQKQNNIFYKGHQLRRVEQNVILKMRHQKLQNSKLFFRELIIKYFLEYPNIKLRLQQKLKSLEDIKICTQVNRAPFSKNYTIASILKSFVQFYKEYAVSKNLVSDFIANFVQFLDMIESLAEDLNIEVESTNQLREVILKILIKSYYRRKEKKSLNEHVTKINKLYTISYIGLENNATYINRQILIECDNKLRNATLMNNIKDNMIAPMKIELDTKHFRNQFENSKILTKPKEVEQLRNTILKNQYSNYEEVKSKICKADVEDPLQDWIQNMDLSLELFRKSKKSNDNQE